MTYVFKVDDAGKTIYGEDYRIIYILENDEYPLVTIIGDSVVGERCSLNRKNGTANSRHSKVECKNDILPPVTA